MEELSREDLIQLVIFYRQKAADLEYSSLLQQLKLNKIILEKEEKKKNSKS